MPPDADAAVAGVEGPLLVGVEVGLTRVPLAVVRSARDSLTVLGLLRMKLFAAARTKPKPRAMRSTEEPSNGCQ